MFLKDLFRYRTTDSKENREDFLSSCLAELMRRDRPAFVAVMQAVGFTVPATVDRYTVRTQVSRVNQTGTMYWCDVLVELPGAAPFVIECKVDDTPKLSQIKRYQTLWKTQNVALLAPERSLPKSKSWNGIPRGSWQAVWEALASAPKAAKGGNFRRAIMDLMTHDNFQLEGCPNQSIGQIRTAKEAWHKQEPLRDPLRQAVLALLKSSAVAPEEPTATIGKPAGRTEARWGEGTPFNAHWSRDADAGGLGLRGLGLEARVQEGVGDATLDWFLWVRPATSTVPKIKAAAKGNVGWTQDGDEWERPLGDTGGPDTPFSEQLSRAVSEGRRWLQRDLGIVVGTASLESDAPAHTSTELAKDVAKAERLDAALTAWCGRLMEQVKTLIEPRLKRSSTVTIVNSTVRVRRAGREPMWLGWEWAIEADPPSLELLVGWQTIAECKAGEAALSGWSPPAGVSPRQYDKYGTGYRVSLADHDLRDATTLLTETAKSLLNHNSQAVLRAINAVP